ncbi:hypothetical protein J6590_086902, partial [Homalodisca vitripennis]
MEWKLTLLFHAWLKTMKKNYQCTQSHQQYAMQYSDELLLFRASLTIATHKSREQTGLFIGVLLPTAVSATCLAVQSTVTIAVRRVQEAESLFVVTFRQSPKLQDKSSSTATHKARYFRDVSSFQRPVTEVENKPYHTQGSPASKCRNIQLHRKQHQSRVAKDRLHKVHFTCIKGGVGDVLSPKRTNRSTLTRSTDTLWSAKASDDF